MAANAGINLGSFAALGVGGVSPQMAQTANLTGVGQASLLNISPEERRFVGSYLQGLQAGMGSIGSSAKTYIANTGIFRPKELEKGVEVRKDDYSEYWTALGYEA